MIRAVNEGVPIVFSRPSSPASVAMQALAVAIVGGEWRQRPRGKDASSRRSGLFLGRR
jgi:MinD-like ATPase involved in chromosome partitioning or flagellar assembly